MADKDSYIPDASFSSLVLTLSSSAWDGLGKIADPLSGEIKKDLKSASGVNTLHKFPVFQKKLHTKLQELSTAFFILQKI